MSNIPVPLFLPFTLRDDSILIHRTRLWYKDSWGRMLAEMENSLLKLNNTSASLPAGTAHLAIQLSPPWWVCYQTTKLGRARGNSTPSPLLMPGVEAGEAKDVGGKGGCLEEWDKRWPTGLSMTTRQKGLTSCPLEPGALSKLYHGQTQGKASRCPGAQAQSCWQGSDSPYRDFI